MIVSFAWTTGAFEARRKTKTRRQWTPEYAAYFKAGTIHQAYNRTPRNGGRRIGYLRVIRAPYIQNTALLSEADFEAEGFAWMEETDVAFRGRSVRQFFEEWKAAAEDVFVLEFERIEPPQCPLPFTKITT